MSLILLLIGCLMVYAADESDSNKKPIEVPKTKDDFAAFAMDLASGGKTAALKELIGLFKTTTTVTYGEKIDMSDQLKAVKSASTYFDRGLECQSKRQNIIESFSSAAQTLPTELKNAFLKHLDTAWEKTKFVSMFSFVNGNGELVAVAVQIKWLPANATPSIKLHCPSEGAYFFSVQVASAQFTIMPDYIRKTTVKTSLFKDKTTTTIEPLPSGVSLKHIALVSMILSQQVESNLKAFVTNDDIQKWIGGGGEKKAKEIDDL